MSIHPACQDLYRTLSAQGRQPEQEPQYQKCAEQVHDICDVPGRVSFTVDGKNTYDKAECYQLVAGKASISAAPVSPSMAVAAMADTPGLFCGLTLFADQSFAEKCVQFYRSQGETQVIDDIHVEVIDVQPSNSIACGNYYNAIEETYQYVKDESGLFAGFVFPALGLDRSSFVENCRTAFSQGKVYMVFPGEGTKVAPFLKGLMIFLRALLVRS